MINGKIILTSLGMESIWGYDQIKENLPKEEIKDASILLITLPEDGLEDALRFWCEHLGFEEEYITVFCEEDAKYIKEEHFDVIYVSDGNTFEMLDYLKKNRLLEFIRENVEEDACYIGCGAGAWIAGKDVERALALEENTVGLTDFNALGLFAGIAIPCFNKENEVRKKVYIDAINSEKYGYVAIIGINEAEVMYKGLHKTLSEYDMEFMRDVVKKINGEMWGQEVSSEKKQDVPEVVNIGVGMKFPVTDENGEQAEASLQSVVECNGVEYAIYTIKNRDGTDNYYASYILQDEDGIDYLKDLDGSEDREFLLKFIESIKKT